MANKVTKPLPEEKPKLSDSIGKKIDYIRRERGLKQEELATKLGVTKKTVIEYEKAEDKIPLQKLISISNILKVPTDFLLGLNDVEDNNIDDKKIHKHTGLSDKAIKVLNELKNNENMMATINFLIEQEEVYTNEFGFTLDKGATEEEQNKAYEKAEQKYYELEEKWDNTHFSIIGKISDYLNISVPSEVVHITNDNIKKEQDFETQLQKFLQTKEKVDIKNLVDTALISDINFKLKRAKKYLEGRNQNKK